jgi:beta-glucanase (GH16 family)
MPRSLHFFAALALIAGLACALPARAQEAFTDHFETLDETRWRVSDGWSNGEWTANDWRRGQILQTPGDLQITLARQRGGDKRFSSGELQSDMPFHYGYYEIRMQAPRGSGLVSGFFTYTRAGGTRTWDEIDVEILGRNTRAVQFTYFSRGQRYITTVRLPFDAAEGMHTYGFEWRPDAIRWFVDGVMMHEELGARGPLPQSAQRLYVHLWNSETLRGWLGPILPWDGPWRLNVDCIAYAPAYEGRSLCGPS